MTKLLSRLLRIAIACCLALPAMGQLSVVVDLRGIPDTCRIGVDTVEIGKTLKGLVLVPRSEMEHFDVRGSDTAFMYLPNLSGPMMRYRQCYKVQGINSNCPWLSFQRYTPTKCE
jgi:hypothetical protein